MNTTAIYRTLKGEEITYVIEGYRVTFGWGNYEDFGLDLPTALEYMADWLRTPQRDPALRRVSLVAINSDERVDFYPTLLQGERTA